MALTLGLKKGESLYIEDDKVSLVGIQSPTTFRIMYRSRVFSVCAEYAVDIGGGVKVTSGYGDMELAKLSMDAPRHITILRSKFYKENNKKEVCG